MTTLSANALPTDLALSFTTVIRQNALRIARRLPSHISIDDLIGAGFMGLVDAYRRYEPSRCDRFDAYAEYRIRGAMLDELRLHDPPLASSSRAGQPHCRRDPQARSAPPGVRRPNRRSPPSWASRSRPIKRIRRVWPWGRRSASTGWPLTSRASSSTTRRSPAPTPASSRPKRKCALDSAVQALPERLRTILEHYYADELTLREIGDRLGVTESRVCQLHGEALARLRAHYAKVERSKPSASRVNSTPRPGPKAPQVPQAAVSRARIAASTPSAWRSNSVPAPALSMM